MKHRYFAAGILVATTVTTGCATVNHELPEAESKAITAADTEIERRAATITPTYVSMEQAYAVVHGVYKQMRPAAHEVCETVAEHDKCHWNVRVDEESDLNAYAAGNNDVHIYRGVLEYAKTRDEVAVVVAHELAHHIANHIEETRQNQLVGALVGGAILGGLSAYAYSNTYSYNNTYYQQQVTDATYAGATVGAAVSNVAFSRNQEREADYIAAYILARSSFDLGTARDMMVKIAVVGDDDSVQSSFGDTHPAGPERLATWDATIAEVAESADLMPVTKEERRASESGDLTRSVVFPTPARGEGG